MTTLPPIIFCSQLRAFFPPYISFFSLLFFAQFLQYSSEIFLVLLDELYWDLLTNFQYYLGLGMHIDMWRPCLWQHMCLIQSLFLIATFFESTRWMHLDEWSLCSDKADKCCPYCFNVGQVKDRDFWILFAIVLFSSHNITNQQEKQPSTTVLNM